MNILKRDINIFYECWNNVEKPVAVLQIFHGMAEHITRYSNFAGYLNRNGIIVFGIDARGHGETGKEANSIGHFADSDGWEKVVSDQKAIYEYMKAQYPDLPFYLLGHSMGSFLARDFINRYPDYFSKVIAMGSGKANDVSYGAARFILSFLNKKAPSKLIHGLAFGAYNKNIENPKTLFDWLSTDDMKVQEYIDDEFCGIPVTNGFYRDFMHGMQCIAESEKDISYHKKILFISGDKDPVGKMGAFVRENYERYINAAEAEIKLYNGLRHEILNEIGREEVYADIVEWLKK